ncbi:MAG: hypothetical protein RQ869_03015 [Candidatus Nanopusillus sp.]|jgi:hypothetical protein|nr:hypothetical protein [Candidatus Nanopusillus sp.]
MVAMQGLAKIVVTFSEEREELAKIETVFTELKWKTGLKKAELYGKALKWIATDEKAKAKFIEYLQNKEEKAQERQLVISK